MYDLEEEVARCHMTYKDGSNDPSMGPTIEMLAVKQSRRGEEHSSELRLPVPGPDLQFSVAIPI